MAPGDGESIRHDLASHLRIEIGRTAFAARTPEGSLDESHSGFLHAAVGLKPANGLAVDRPYAQPQIASGEATPVSAQPNFLCVLFSPGCCLLSTALLFSLGLLFGLEVLSCSLVDNFHGKAHF